MTTQQWSEQHGMWVRESNDPQLPDMDVVDRAFAERLPIQFRYIGSHQPPPEPTCPECDAELVDCDMAEDEDGRQYGTGNCPDPDCEANQ